jgi:sugar phosphate isomerase/epimerase
MKPAFFKTLWGHEGAYAEAARAAVVAGFSGFEGPIPTDPDRRREFLDALAEYRLLYIGEISTTGFAVPDPGSTVEQHLDRFERVLADTLEAKPIFFSAMAGSDLWEPGDSVRFLTRAWEIAGSYGVRVGFETHRSRSLFHPVVTRALLRDTPPIELTLDFSHWCVVCERLVLDELPDVLALCAERALHIQPRIGHEQGAQVSNPRAAAWQPALQAHLRWWRAVWESQRRRGFSRTTMTPEFGPDGYQQLDAYTREPAGDLWDFNTWVAAVLRRAFAES